MCVWIWVCISVYAAGYSWDLDLIFFIFYLIFVIDKLLDNVILIKYDLSLSLFLFLFIPRLLFSFGSDSRSQRFLTLGDRSALLTSFGGCINPLGTTVLAAASPPLHTVLPLTVSILHPIQSIHQLPQLTFYLHLGLTDPSRKVGRDSCFPFWVTLAPLLFSSSPLSSSSCCFSFSLSFSLPRLSPPRSFSFLPPLFCRSSGPFYFSFFNFKPFLIIVAIPFFYPHFCCAFAHTHSNFDLYNPLPPPPLLLLTT